MKAIVVGALMALVGPTVCFADEKSCTTAAFQDYITARQMLLTQTGMNLSVESTIAWRRLQEQFCLRWATCLAGPDQPWVPKVSPNLAKLALAAKFGSCLDDEAEEDLKNRVK